MNLDEAKAIIDRAWNAGPRLIDWDLVEEASCVIAAELGTVYEPPDDHDEFVARRHRPSARAPKAAAPHTRGTASGYDTAARQGDGIATGIQNAHEMLKSSTGLEKTTRGSIRGERSMRELLEGDRKPPGWP